MKGHHEGMNQGIGVVSQWNNVKQNSFQQCRSTLFPAMSFDIASMRVREGNANTLLNWFHSLGSLMGG